MAVFLTTFIASNTVGTGATSVAFGTTALGYAIEVGGGDPIQITYGGLNASSNKPGAGWIGLGAAISGSGYDLFWHNTANDSYALWHLDSNGILQNGKGLSGSDLYSAETAAGMDFTGDGNIGTILSSANFIINLPIDMINLNLNMMISNESKYSSYTYLNENSIYSNLFVIEWNYNSNFYQSIFKGYDFNYDINLQNYKLISGTVTGYLELYWNGNQWINSWGVENINISAAEIFNDALTTSTFDDYTTFQKILSGNDSIIGSPYNDTLYGGVGSDILTGGGGADKFVYKNNDSLLSSFDTIIDFNYNCLLKIGHTVSVEKFINKSIVGTGSLQNDLASTLAGQALNFIQNSAALIAISGSASDAGTYAVIANHTNSNPGFVASTDTVIKLQNYQQGSLTAYSFIV